MTITVAIPIGIPIIIVSTMKVLESLPKSQ